MKKSIKKYVIIICIAALILWRCWPGPLTYRFGGDTDQIASIEIAEGLDESDAWKAEYESREVITLIQEEMWTTFLSDFKQVECHKYWNDPCQAFSGEIIFITYADGAIEIISEWTTFYHALGEKKGKFSMYYFDNDQFADLIDKYVREAQN